MSCCLVRAKATYNKETQTELSYVHSFTIRSVPMQNDLGKEKEALAKVPGEQRQDNGTVVQTGNLCGETLCPFSPRTFFGKSIFDSYETNQER